MKNCLILPFLLLVLTACGGKKTASTSFVLNASALISGTTPVGGIALVGKSGSDTFSVGLSAANAASFSVDLPQGDWNFAAIAWLDDSGQGAMTGKVRCGVSNTQIQGTEATVNLSLTHAACSNQLIASATHIDSNTYTAISENTFKKVGLNSCLNPIGLTTEACDGSSLARTPGEHLSFRLVFPGAASFGQAMPNLVSNCFNIASPNNGQFMTDVRWPIGGDIKFPGVIVGYEKFNCQDADDTKYYLPKGFLGGEGLAHFIQTSTVSNNYFTIADNYVGHIGSPFYDAHVVDTSIKLPLASCGKSCFGTITTAAGDYSKTRDIVRDSIWNLLGSFDGNSPNETQPGAQASAFFTSTGSGSFMVQAIQGGIEGNNIDVFVGATSGPTGTTTATCGGNTITMNWYDNDKSPASMVTAINAACSHLVTATVSNPADDGTWTGSQFLTGGTTNIIFNRREEGALTRAAHMLVGPIGAVLSKGGITSAQLCTVGYSGSASFQLPGESIVVSVAPSSAPMPTGLGTKTLSSFQRKLTLLVNGVAEEAYFYNCAGNDIGFGIYTSVYSDASEVSKETIYWNVGAPSAEKIEHVARHVKNSNSYWAHKLFEGTGTVGNWNVWGMEGSQSNSSYQKYTGQKTGDNLYTQRMSGLANTNTDTSYLSNDSEDAWTISTGAFGGNSVTTNTIDPTVFTEALATSAINDLVNNVSPLFIDPASY